MSNDNLSDAIRDLTPIGVATFACCCAERTAELWRKVGDQRISRLVSDTIESSWAALLGDDAAQTALATQVEGLYAELGEDSAFGPHHSLLFDSIMAVGHAATAVGGISDTEIVAREGMLARKACVTLVKGAYFERHGTYVGSEQYEGFAREEGWQVRDAHDLKSDSSIESIENLRLRARREATLIVDGVVNNNWHSELPAEDWPTLF